MPKYKCSYAYDVPHYQDFIVEAKSIAEAQKIMDAALKVGRFENVTGEACYDNLTNERAFVSEKLAPSEVAYDDTMENVIKAANENA